MYLFFGMLLNCERVDADLAIIGGVEALNVADDLLALLWRQILEGRVIGESEVGSLPILNLMQKSEGLRLLITLSEFPLSVAAVVTFERVGVKVGLADEVPEFRWSAMDELGTQLDDLIPLAHCENAATNTIASLEDKYPSTGLGENAGGRETRHSGAHDQNALIYRIHQVIGCGTSQEVIEGWLTPNRNWSSNETA